MFDRITKFHKEFMQKYSDEGEEKYERLNGTVV